jgi:hypothetical protein
MKPRASRFAARFFWNSERFPNVQMLVDRPYGSRVVEAVVDNQADFGITQLPVQENARRWPRFIP